ncbi:MAG: hypothetical protein KAH18_03615 [Psychromonas sp.]|nr:hypothetical protein [Psychromonas sp.]
MQLFFKIIFIISIVLLGACSQSDIPNQQHEHSIKGSIAAEISQNGDYSIISSIRHGLSFWDNRTHKILYQWQHNKKINNNVFILRISADNSRVLSATRHEFALWNTKTGKSVGFYKVTESPIQDIQLSASGRYVLYGQGNGKLVHIDLKTGRRLEMPIHTGKINSVDLSGNGRYALSGGNDHHAFLWNTKTAQIIQQFHFKHRVSMVRLEENGRFAFIADTQKASQIWNLKTGKLQSTLIYNARQSIFSTVRFIDNGEHLLTGAPNRKITLWDANSGRSLQSWKVTGRKNSRLKTAVVFSATRWDKNNIASESSAGLFEIWAIKNKH